MLSWLSGRRPPAWAATATSYDEALGCALLPLPLSHVYGLMVSVMNLHAPGPGTSVLMRWFDPRTWLELAQDHKVNVSPLVPSMLQMLLEQPLEDYDLSALTRLNTNLISQHGALAALRDPDYLESAAATIAANLAHLERTLENVPGARLADLDDFGASLRLPDKPYRKRDLARTLREVLAEPAPVDI